MARTEHMTTLSVQEWAFVERDLCLSPRQAEIMRLILQGMSDKQIGWQLHIAFGTVRTHMSRLFQKCGVNGRLELLADVYMRLHRLCQNHEPVFACPESGHESGCGLWTLA